MDIIWLGLFYLYTVFGYLKLSAIPTDRHFMTPWEHLVPTIPLLLIPYFTATFSFLALPIFFYIKLGWIKTKIYLITQVMATTIGYLFYFFWPTSVIRSPITGTGFFNGWLRWLHTNDRPSAAFPSGHVYHSTVMAYFLWIYFPITRPCVAVVYPLIVLATVMLKQHYLPDILGGLATGIIAILITKYLIS